MCSKIENFQEKKQQMCNRTNHKAAKYNLGQVNAVSFADLGSPGLVGPVIRPSYCHLWSQRLLSFEKIRHRGLRSNLGDSDRTHSNADPSPFRNRTSY